MFTPGIAQIASDLHTTPSTVVGATTGFVVCLGIGPLILAPLSETFGRRKLYLICFSIFAVSQIPTALSPNIASLLTFRAISGFFGSVGIANGGGTISDMFHPSERAGIFGWYLLGPLLGPTLGPLFGGLIVQDLNWRWLFWILTIIAFLNTLAGFFFLRESYAPVILERRRQGLQANDDGKTYRIPDADTRPLYRQVFSSVQRPIKILFTQPIVLVMSTYIAVLFGTTYSLWTNFEAIYGASGYGFSTTQVGLMYLGPGIGFLLAVFFIVPRIDTVYNHLTAQNDGKAKPEFRLPLANIGSILIPASLFTYAWTVEYRVHWFVTIVATVFFGLGQISVLNTTQNYYIDAFMKYAASAIAAGAVFRSLVGGVVPLVAQPLFEKVGYGWGISVFAFAALAMSPAPLLFQRYGPKVRERFEVDL